MSTYPGAEDILMPTSDDPKKNPALTRKRAEPPVIGVMNPSGIPGMLTRNQLAQRLGVSGSEIRRREQTGELVPTAKHPAGWNLYDENAVAQARRPKQRRAGVDAVERSTYSPEDAVTVFKMLEAGKTLVQTVLDSNLHPNIVEAVALDYARMTGTLLIPQFFMDQINKLTLEGTFPIKDAPGLLEVMELAANDLSCTSCGKRSRSVCGVCVKVTVRDALREERVRVKATEADAEAEVHEPSASSDPAPPLDPDEDSE